jgi:hypothetical protein
MLSKKRLGSHLTTGVEICVSTCLASLPIIKANPLTKPLSYDGGVFVYLAQQIASGNPPYMTVFDHKTPLAGILGAIFIELGRLFNIYDLYAVRAGALILSIIHVLLILLLIKALTKSSVAAITGAVLLAGFSGYAEINASWLDPKCILIVAQTAMLYCILKDKLVIAGICSILAGLSWQPGFISCLLGLLTILIIYPRQRKNIARYLVGIGLSSAIFLAYIYFQGAFTDFILQAFVFNVTKYIPEKVPTSLLEQTRHIYGIINRFYGPEVWEFQVALILVPIFTFFTFKPVLNKEDVQIRRTQGLYIAVLGFTFTYLFLSLANFQGGPDLLPFLPNIVLIIVLTSHQIISALEHKLNRAINAGNNHSLLALIIVIYPLMVAAPTVISFRHLAVECPHTTLQEQEEWITGLINHSKIKSIQVVGAPEFLAISHTKNASRFIYFYNGVADFYSQEISTIKNIFSGSGAPDMIVVSRNEDNPFNPIIKQNYTLISQFSTSPDDDVDSNLHCYPSQVLQTQVYSIKKDD